MDEMAKEKPVRRAPTEHTPSTSQPTPQRTIRQILEGDDSFRAWLRPRKGGITPDVFIVVADRLSEEDRNVLARSTDLNVPLDLDLISRLREKEEENRHLRSLIVTDDLTGLYNKRFFSIQLATEMARTRRTGLPCALVVVDFDHFKMINDVLGHDEGDRFLMQMGRLILNSLRPTDLACRFGGDEFAVIMPASNLTDTVHVARRLHEAIAAAIARSSGVIKDHVSSSMGITVYYPSAHLSPEDLFKRADDELYRAKKGGKNRISYDAQAEREHVERNAVSQNEKDALMSIIRDSNPGKKSHPKGSL